MDTDKHGFKLGLRRQSAVATALLDARETDKRTQPFVRPKSGVALRFPPQSKIVSSETNALW
jgi:hypothetical protein